jgi:hypothetical protein
MENLRIGLLAKQALNLPELIGLRDSAVKRIVNVKPHADVIGSDWGSFRDYVNERLRITRRILVVNGPLGRVNGMTEAVARIVSEEFLTVELDDLIKPIRAKYWDKFDDPSDLDYLVSPPEPPADYVRFRDDMFNKVMLRWRVPLLMSYNGVEQIDFRKETAISGGCVLIWIPTPEELLLQALALSQMYCTTKESDFMTKLGYVLVNTVQMWLFHLERMTGYYGRYAVALRMTVRPDACYLSPMSLGQFQDAVLDCLDPESYVNLVLTGNGNRPVRKLIENGGPDHG